MLTKAFFFLLLSIQLIFASRLSVAVFPFKNESGSVLYDWAGYGFSESISRKLIHFTNVQTWDPVFLFRTDSSCWRMESDSLIEAHRIRWHWDVAIGGGYHEVNDTIVVNYKVIAFSDGAKLSYQHIVVGNVNEFDELCGTLIKRIFLEINQQILIEDSASLMRNLGIEPPVYKTYAMGYGYEMLGKIDQALSSYHRALELSPGVGPVLCRLGDLYKKDGDYKKAEKYFHAALSASSSDPYIVADAAEFMVEAASPSEAAGFIKSRSFLLEKTSAGLKAMGKFYISTGEYQRAIANLTKAVAMFPSDLDVDFTLGEAYLDAREFTSSIDIFNRIILYRPNFYRLYSLLGAAYRMSGRLMESTMILETALKLFPSNAVIFTELANTYFDLSWYEKAEQMLTKAAEIEPKLNEIYINLGVVYLQLGLRDKAAECFKIASRNPALIQSVKNNTGNLLFKEGKINAAIKAYRKAEKSGKTNPVVLYNLAAAYLTINKLKKASFYFDELLRLSPDRLDILDFRADIAEKRGNKTQAEFFYRKILDISPYNEKALKCFVELLVTEKRFEDALHPIETYLDHYPNSSEFLILLADVYRYMGWYEVALERYQAIEKDFPESPKGYMGAGKCMLEMIKSKKYENYENAIYAFKMVCQYDHDNPEPYIIIGDIYMEYKGYRELAIENWKKAVERTNDKEEVKKIRERINGAEINK